MSRCGLSALAGLQGNPLDFGWTNGWPASEVPTNSVLTNSFAARWSGVVQPLVQGDPVFDVSAEAGAAYGLP
jgi:hypothetical protein